MAAYGPSSRSMLASSADRDRAVDVLRAGLAEGRLTQAEFSKRVTRVQASRTYYQLAELVGDLPVGPHAPAPDFGSPGSPALTAGSPAGSAVAEIDDRRAATPLAHLALTALVVFTLAALFTALIVYMHILGQPTSVQVNQGTPGVIQLPPAQLLPSVHHIVSQQP